MRVLVWVHHELGPALNSLLLLPLTDLVKDGMNYLVNSALLADPYNGFDHLMLNILGIEVDSHVTNILLVEDGTLLAASLHDYGVNDLLDEPHLLTGRLLILVSTRRCTLRLF